MQKPLRMLSIPAALAVGLAAGAFAQSLEKYVATGDSLTAAFSSGSLHLEGQVPSYPALVALAATGAIDGFEQPLVTDPGIPNVLTLQSLSPVVIAPKPGQGLPINLMLERPYDNLAVPGADLADLVARVTDSGGLHDLILRGLGTQLEQALFLQPTFLSMWIGNNDALGAATSGIVIDGITLTTAEQFAAGMAAVTGALAAAGVPAGVFATVPSVTAIPFVTTIPPVLVDPATDEPVIIEGRPVPLLGPDGPLVPGRDFVLLTATDELARGIGIPQPFGTGQPLPDDAVLSGDEAARINARVAEFNAIIRDAAARLDFAVADTAAAFDEIRANGIELGGIEYATDFLTGGLFSLDGVHPSPLGYAIAADVFLAAINAHYGSEFPPVDLTPFVFGGVGLPGSGKAVPETASLLFTREAYENLRSALRTPKTRKLLRIKRRLQRQGGSTSAVAADAAREGRRVERRLLRRAARRSARRAA